MKKPTLLTHNNFKKELMKRPLFRKAHAELDFEFQILEALIRARMEKKLTDGFRPKFRIVDEGQVVLNRGVPVAAQLNARTGRRSARSRRSF